MGREIHPSVSIQLTALGLATLLFVPPVPRQVLILQLQRPLIFLGPWFPLFLGRLLSHGELRDMGFRRVRRCEHLLWLGSPGCGLFRGDRSWRIGLGLVDCGGCGGGLRDSRLIAKGKSRLVGASGTTTAGRHCAGWHRSVVLIENELESPGMMQRGGGAMTSGLHQATEASRHLGFGSFNPWFTYEIKGRK